MSLREAEILALRTLKQVMEEKINTTNIEIASIPLATHRYRVSTREELTSLMELVDASSSLSSSIST
jgi:20S proteasome subunit alpha 5